jgi:predicted outer membrane lipoprotein
MGPILYLFNFNMLICNHAICATPMAARIAASGNPCRAEGQRQRRSLVSFATMPGVLLAPGGIVTAMRLERAQEMRQKSTP